MKLLTGSQLLNEQQRRFVAFVRKRGFDFESAAEAAGYAKNYGHELRRNPAVAAAIHESIQSDLQGEFAPMAYSVARELLLDTQVSARVRADLSIKILDRAGHTVPTKRDSAAHKALSEMSQRELLDFIAKNQAEIDKAEGELAAQAIDVSPQTIQPLDAKPLTFLD